MPSLKLHFGQRGAASVVVRTHRHRGQVQGSGGSQEDHVGASTGCSVSLTGISNSTVKSRFLLQGA
jgi:hypothetical protein